MMASRTDYFDDVEEKACNLPRCSFSNLRSSFFDMFFAGMLIHNASFKESLRTWKVLHIQHSHYSATAIFIMLIRPLAIQSARRAARLHQCLSTTANNLNATTTTAVKNRQFSSGGGKEIMYDVVPKENFGDYKEYSVIFTNRSLNLMSDPFQTVMRDLNNLLKTTYNARKVAIIPG